MEKNEVLWIHWCSVASGPSQVPACLPPVTAFGFTAQLMLFLIPVFVSLSVYVAVFFLHMLNSSGFKTDQS